MSVALPTFFRNCNNERMGHCLAIGKARHYQILSVLRWYRGNYTDLSEKWFFHTSAMGKVTIKLRLSVRPRAMKAPYNRHWILAEDTLSPAWLYFFLSLHHPIVLSVSFSSKRFEIRLNHEHGLLLLSRWRSLAYAYEHLITNIKQADIFHSQGSIVCFYLKYYDFPKVSWDTMNSIGMCFTGMSSLVFVLSTHYQLWLH